LASVSVNSNQLEKAKGALAKAIEYDYKIPERSLFGVRFFNYILNQEPEKAMAVLRMWVELYPEDVQAHTTLANRLIMSNDNAGAIAEYKTVLRLDPEQYDFLPAMGRLYQKSGKPDSAIYYFKLYADKFPKDYQS